MQKDQRVHTSVEPATTKAERLTVEEVRQTKGFEHLTEDEAKAYIDTIERYCLLLYNQFSRITKTTSYES